MKTYKGRWRPIFVLGIDRSGTSLLSEVVVNWGAHPGAAEKLAPADAQNPQGYWEYLPMQDFVAALIASVGVSTWEPDFMARVRERAFEPSWRDQALALAAEMERPDRPWLWKEPAIALTLSFWQEIVEDVVFLITLRNPVDSAASFKKFFLPSALREKFEIDGFFFLKWQHYMLSTFGTLASHQRV
ncbi:MAG: hypothetical protein HC897_16200 [Thermoanaerobaculia bacterium]|nr:hypothetical protein [Thermoanaerobaculia bacterium]